MKRLTRVAAIAVVVVAAFTLCFAPASLAQGPKDSTLSIRNVAALWAFGPGFNGLWISVSVRCTGNAAGTVEASATQSSSQSNTGSSDTGGLPTTSQVQCDGVTRQVALSYLGEGQFNLGYATATATLTPPSGPSVTVQRVVRVVSPTS